VTKNGKDNDLQVPRKLQKKIIRALTELLKMVSRNAYKGLMNVGKSVSTAQRNCFEGTVVNSCTF
jgi:Txe/YoeB family toxin of Txe-Axe toxin-antitoxin module